MEEVILKRFTFGIYMRKVSYIILWLRRLIVYFFLYDLLIIISLLIFPYFGLFHNDLDSARYMLSALVQSEAAIIAIVITLSLVAVQLAAQSYSTKIIDGFKKNPDFWILIVIYIISMIYELGVLKKIENNNFGDLTYLDNHVSFSYFLGIFTFTALIPYILNTLNLLKISTVIDMLSKKITKESILYSIGDENKNTNYQDPLQPIIDIIHGSLMRYDIETVRNGLRAIGEQTNFLFINETFTEKEEKIISKHIFHHLYIVGRLAVDRVDKDSTLEVLNILHKTGKTAAEKKLDYATGTAAESLGKLGKLAKSTGVLIELTVKAVEFLENIGKTALEYKLKYGTNKIIFALGIIGLTSAMQELRLPTKKAALSLGKLGIAYTEHELESETIIVVRQLEKIGKAASESEIKSPLLRVIQSLGEVGKTSAKHELENATKRVINSLENIGKEAAEHGFESLVNEVIETLEIISKLLVINRHESGIFNVVVVYQNVGKIVVDKKLINSTKRIVEVLEEIGKISAKQKQKGVTKKVALVLTKVGYLTIEQKMKGSTKKVIKSLREVGKAAIEEELSVVVQIEENIREMDEAFQNHFEHKNILRIY